MKIAFLVNVFPLLSQTFILNQITGLIDRGHQVTIFALYGKGASEGKHHPDVYHYSLLDYTHYPPHVPADRPAKVLKTIGLLAARLGDRPSRLLKLLKLCRHRQAGFSLERLYQGLMFLGQEEFDIIHCQFGTLGLEGLVFREHGLLRGKWVTTFRGYDISSVIHSQGSSFYDWLWQSGDLFMANCQFFRQRAIALGCPPDRILVHGSGINCQRFAFSTRSLPTHSPIHVITVGRLVEKKGIEYGIRAIAKLVRSPECLPANVALSYSIVGEGPLRATLQRLIDDLGLHGSVQLLGQMPQAELIEVLNSAQIFLAPCVTAADGDQDAPVNTLKEAMAMGLPVISTHHGGIPELVEDGTSGLLVPERDVNALAEAIATLIHHPEWWPAMGRAGHLAVKTRYDTDQLNDELVRLYQSLLPSSTVVAVDADLWASTEPC